MTLGRRVGVLLLGVLIALVVAGPSLGGSTNGSAGQMSAYYDNNLFTINFKLEPSGSTLLAQNKSVNVIYMCDACSFSFTSVLNAIQGDGFNPLWKEEQITFNTISPRQFTSDNAIETAAALGQITLRVTGEVYRCSVVGPT